MLLAAAQLQAAPPKLVLVAPRAPSVLSIALPLPQGAKADQPLRLAEVGGSGEVVPVQLIASMQDDGLRGRAAGRLTALIDPREGSGSPQRFLLKTAPAAHGQPAGGFRFQEVDDKSLGLWENDHPVFVYNHGVITNENVPENDHRRSRASYVHPVWGLNGEVLTDDFPKDHYHHHGVFWTWPYVRVGEESYDLWAGPNIHDRFVRWLDRETGPIAAVLAVENGWFVGEKKVMIERVWIRAYRQIDQQRSLDFDFVWIPVDQPVTLQGREHKSYGGFTMRFAPRKDPTVIRIPSGPANEDVVETPLPWADLTARFLDESAPSGAAVFVPPQHPDYPPTWLARHYGCLCVGWPGVNPQTFQPGESIRASYRVWIHKTAVDPADLQKGYDSYVAGTKAKWARRKKASP